MSLDSKVKELRDKLLENCKYAIERLKAAKERVIYYSAQNQESTSTNSGPPNQPQDNLTDTKGSENVTTYEITDKAIIKSFMELTHGVLIQEWEHFLYDIFSEGVVYYLNGYNLETPKFKVNFRDLKQTKNIAEMHENISSEAKKSLQGYEELIEQSRKTFKTKTNDSELFQEMQKQMQIRHIFQHSRGEIRAEDIEKIKSQCFKVPNKGQCFKVVDDAGNTITLGVRDKVELSQQEIQKLFDTIERYSEEFLTQAKSIVPLKENRGR
jgi:hypothetical protein